MADRAYTTDELEAAVSAIADPARLRTAQDVVLRTAPGLQRVLTGALEDGGWFDAGHEQAVREVAAHEDPDRRLRELRTLLAEETRLGMMVGVAVGFELARELDGSRESDGSPGLDGSRESDGSPGHAPPADRNTENQTKEED